MAAVTPAHADQFFADDDPLKTISHPAYDATHMPYSVVAQMACRSPVHLGRPCYPIMVANQIVDVEFTLDEAHQAVYGRNMRSHRIIRRCIQQGNPPNAWVLI